MNSGMGQVVAHPDPPRMGIDVASFTPSIPTQGVGPLPPYNPVGIASPAGNSSPGVALSASPGAALIQACHV